MKCKFIVILLFVISSCASRNFHAENYSPNVHISKVPLPDRVPIGSDPLIISTKNLDQDYATLLSKGYILLGHSSFEGELDEKYNLIQQGRDVGATVILTTNEFLGISSSTIPLLLPTSSTTYSTGSVFGSGSTQYRSSTGGYLGQSSTSYNGSYFGQSTTQSSQWVPMTVSKTIYHQTSAFFVKTNQPFKLGLYYRDLNQNERKALERNTGIIVTTVIENTPAFFRNIVVGDVITVINDVEIMNYSHASSVINSTQQLKNVKILRNGKELAISIGDSSGSNRDISSIKK